MLRRLLCALQGHRLLRVNIQERGASIVGERCRCAHRIENVRVYQGVQFPRRRA